MRIFVLALIALGALGARPSCAGQEGTVFPGVIDAAREVDARVWLHRPHPGNDFFDKKVMSRREAERLVDKLYADGALSVTMVFLMGEAQGFRVYLPTDLDLRREVLALVNKEMKRSGAASYLDNGQESVVIWLK